jgi:branched-subunit amino acid ABC-type transport system permease component/ABC-type branched-subunit amino acid transport system ATPase component
MSNLLALLVSGMVAGAIYSMFASGLTLVYATTGIYNFAFGAMAFVAGLVFYQMFAGLGVPRLASFAITIVVLAPLSAIVVERVVFRPLARAPERNRLLGSVGLVVGLPAAAYVAVDFLTNVAHVHLVNLNSIYLVAGVGPEPPTVYKLFSGVTVNSDQLIALGGTLAAVGALWLLMTRTRMGLETRAVVDRSELASLRGINAARTSRLAWILSVTLAGLAGVLASPIFGLSPDTNLQFVIGSSAVFVIARFRSLPIAMIGGLVLGALSSVVAGYFHDVPGLKQALTSVPGVTSSTIYVVLLAGLLWQGRERIRVAGSSAVAEPIPGDYLRDLPQWRRAWVWVTLGVVLLVWSLRIVPWGHLQAGGEEQSLVITGLATSLVFLSFCVVVGMLGVVSLAQAAFVTTGGLMAGLVVHDGILGGSFVVAVVIGALASTVLALVVALPALRLGGMALALATLALAYMGDEILFQIKGFDNYPNGWTLNLPHVGPLDFKKSPQMIVFLVLIVVLALWVVKNIRASVTGRSIMAVRFAPAAAASVGLSSRNAILAAFGVTGFLAGLGGVLLAYTNGTANATNYPTDTGLLWVTIAVLWGVRRLSGAILAGLSGSLFPRILQTGFWGITPRITNPTVPVLLFGLSCIALANQPDGLLADMSRRRYLDRERRRTRRTAPEATPAVQVRAEPGDAPVPVTDGQHAPVEVALELVGVSGGYVDSEVLHQVNLTVPRGKVVAILGPNGAGKSTLCGLIGGSVTRTDGRILLDKIDITSLRADQRFARGVVVVPEARGIFPALSVEENLEVTLPDAQDRGQVMDRYPQLRIRRRIPARSLSGGEQQLLALAPLLLHPPRLLIADELSLGLSPTIYAQMVAILRDLREAGVSMLMVEEKARNVVQLADYCAFLSQGRVTAFGPMSEFTEEVAAESYLGPKAMVTVGSPGATHVEERPAAHRSLNQDPPKRETGDT